MKRLNPQWSQFISQQTKHYLCFHLKLTIYPSMYVCMYVQEQSNKWPFQTKVQLHKIASHFLYIRYAFCTFLGYKLNYMSLPLQQALADHAPYLVQEIDIPSLKPQLQQFKGPAQAAMFTPAVEKVGSPAFCTCSKKVESGKQMLRVIQILSVYYIDRPHSNV